MLSAARCNALTHAWPSAQASRVLPALRRLELPCFPSTCFPSTMSKLAGAILNSTAAPPGDLVRQGQRQPQAKPKAQPKAKALSRLRSRIDLDDDVEAAKAAAREAKKALRKKVTDAKLARKKKMRLVSKASKLPSDDLYRIALYKRVNLMNAMVSKDMAGAVGSMLEKVDHSMLETLLRDTLAKRAVAEPPTPEGQSAGSGVVRAACEEPEAAAGTAASGQADHEEVAIQSPASAAAAQEDEEMEAAVG